MARDRLQLRPGTVLLLEDLAPDLASDLLDCARPRNDATDAVAYVLATYPVDVDETTVRGYLASIGAWLPHQLSDPERNLGRFLWILACELREHALFALDAAPDPPPIATRGG